MEKVLKDYGLVIRESDAPDREEVDFRVADKQDNVAEVWGDYDDYEVDCDHVAIDFPDDEDECGECLICGAQCNWHYERDVYDDHEETREVVDRVADTWYNVGDGGIIKEYIEQMKGEEE